jgi:DNA-binding CsgD family transcriptional regulator
MSHLEIWRVGHPHVVFELGAESLTIGSDPGNGLVIEGDPTVSRTHLRLDRLATGWMAEDLGSRNGSFVNGSRMLGPRVLRSDDELRLGTTRLVFRGGVVQAQATAPARELPSLTPRQRECLAELCAPVLNGTAFTEPAGVKQIAAALFVSESAVKKLLGRLYDKFDLEGDDRRRGRLASEALARGAGGTLG